MTREDEIINTAQKYYSDNIKCYDAFLHGVQWADEYPNLESLWHDASEEPKYDILVQDKFEDTWVTNLRDEEEYYQDGWEEYVACEGIVRWAYVKDLLPKREEK
ncbi:MAG: hypothetical protein ACI4SO_04190 [Muribaculaceae bacterium]